jgi:transposase InsO family protein
MGFIDTMRSRGHAVESICRVLREQGCQVAARTYRSWKRSGRVVAARTVTDAHVVDAVRDIAWTTKVDSDGDLVRKLSPEGLYSRRKMTAYLRRTAVPDASAGSVDRAMRALGLSGVRRDNGIRTTIPVKDGSRAGDLLDRDFTAAAANRTWVTDFTYVRTWGGVAAVIDAHSRRVIGWAIDEHMRTDLVEGALRMAVTLRGNLPA